MILMLPLGVIYFSVFITLISLALGFIAAPVAQMFIPFPLMSIGDAQYYLSPSLMILFGFFGIGVAYGTLHLAKLVGRWHGSFAKAMLVSE
jgi:hypothetical protein